MSIFWFQPILTYFVFACIYVGVCYPFRACSFSCWRWQKFFLLCFAGHSPKSFTGTTRWDHVVTGWTCSFFSSQCQSLSSVVMKGLVCCLRPWKWMRYQGQSFPTHVLRPVKLWKANCILPYGRVLACSSVGAQETILSALQNGSLVLFNSLNH